MIKTTVTVHGMMCHMCERNISNIIEKSFNVDSVVAMREQEQVIIYSEEHIDEQRLYEVLTGQGFMFEKMEVE